MSDAMKEIKAFLEEDEVRAAELLRQYPDRVPVKAAAEFLKCSPDTVRAWVERGGIGICEKQIGKQNRAFLIPTAQLLRWYLLWHNLKWE